MSETPEGLCTRCSAAQYCAEHEPPATPAEPLEDMHKSDCAKHGDDEHDATPWQRCDCGAEPTKDWYRRRCAWYTAEIDRMRAAHATQQAAIRALVADWRTVGVDAVDLCADQLARLLGAEPMGGPAMSDQPKWWCTECEEPIWTVEGSQSHTRYQHAVVVWPTAATIARATGESAEPLEVVGPLTIDAQMAREPDVDLTAQAIAAMNAGDWRTATKLWVQHLDAVQRQHATQQAELDGLSKDYEKLLRESERLEVSHRPPRSRRRSGR